MADFGNNIQGYHYNANLLCAIDTETTGLVPAFHDITEIAIIPLTYDYVPDKRRTPFHTHLIPKRPHNFDPETSSITKKTLDDCIRNGIDAYTAADRFHDWFENLHLLRFKKITVLGMNYLAFDMHFIMDWLGGWKNYNFYFRSDVRDVMLTACHHNDIAEDKSEQLPFRAVGLKDLSSLLGVEMLPAHDALSDALAAAECYRRLLKRMH